MRRTLALAGAAILAAGLGGLASGGSASADHGVAHNVEVSEIAVDLNTTFQGGLLEGTFVELQNNTDTSKNLSNYVVRGCNATGVFDILDFGSSSPEQIAAGDQYLIADINYSGGPTAEASFANPAQSKLNQDDGGVMLIDSTGTVNGSRWGMPHPACASLDPADGSASPTDTNSLHYDTEIDVWCAALPNPHGASPSCAN